MKKMIVSLIVTVCLTITWVATDTAKAQGCYYTDRTVCLPAGAVIYSSPVYCVCGPECTATLYDSEVTDNDAYAPTAPSVGPGHIQGYSGIVLAIGSTKVNYKTETVDPDTCTITTVDPAGWFTKNCGGYAADPNSTECWYAEYKPSELHSYYCLAVLGGGFVLH